MFFLELPHFLILFENGAFQGKNPSESEAFEENVYK